MLISVDIQFTFSFKFSWSARLVFLFFFFLWETKLSFSTAVKPQGNEYSLSVQWRITGRLLWSSWLKSARRCPDLWIYLPTCCWFGAFHLGLNLNKSDQTNSLWIGGLTLHLPHLPCLDGESSFVALILWFWLSNTGMGLGGDLAFERFAKYLLMFVTVTPSGQMYFFSVSGHKSKKDKDMRKTT